MPSATRQNDFESFLPQLPQDQIVCPQRESGETISSGETGIAEAIRLAATQTEGGYPPLHESVFPGDSIAIVVQDELPQPQVILKSVIELLMETRVEPSDITVVVSPAMAKTIGLPDLIVEQPEVLADIGADKDSKSTAVAPQAAPHPLDSSYHNAGFIIHDADGEQNVAYIAANEAALPMKVNRAIAEADVILPLGFPVPGDRDQMIDCIYPTFATEETRQRFASGDETLPALLKEITLANDMLGAFYAMQFVTAPGGLIADVCSGTRADVLRKSLASSQKLWALPMCEADQLVLSTIESSGRNNEWDDFVLAVFAASEVSASDLPIIVWSSIRKKASSAVRKALNRQFDPGTNIKLTPEMNRLAGIVEGRQIYLFSKLSRNATEELGLGYISKEGEIKRLIENSAGCVIVRDAHKCNIGSPDGEVPVHKTHGISEDEIVDKDIYIDIDEAGYEIKDAGNRNEPFNSGYEVDDEGHVVEDTGLSDRELD